MVHSLKSSFWRHPAIEAVKNFLSTCVKAILFVAATETDHTNANGNVDSVPSASQTAGSNVLRVVTRPSSSLTKMLAQRIVQAGLPSLKLPAFLFGPYGHAHRLGQSGTVIFVLEDIGLFRALPFIRDLVEKSRERTNMVRRLEVLWQTEYSKFSKSMTLQKVCLTDWYS